MPHKYTPEQANFIKENIVGISTYELTDKFNARFGLNLERSKIRAYVKNRKFKSGAPGGLQPGKPTELYPEEIQKFIENNYINNSRKMMAELLNKTFESSYTEDQIKSYYRNHRIASSLDGRFEKGCIPVNKGKKFPGLYSNATQFKKGIIPHNYLPVGSERINGDGYWDVKIADPDVWKYKQILVWEKHNGPVPKGHAVIFGDRDRHNFDIDNLILVSKQQLSVMNGRKLIKNNAEFTKTGLIIANLYLKASERKSKGRARVK